jgi:hypothetical protein
MDGADPRRFGSGRAAVALRLGERPLVLLSGAATWSSR